MNTSVGGSYDDELYSIQQTSDAEYIATGRTKSYAENNYDLFLVKTDENGNILWQKNYGGAKDDEGYSVEVTGDGGYIVAGRTRSYGSGMYDIWLMKVDSSGEKTWDKTFGGALDDEASGIKQTDDGGFIIAGSTKSKGNGMYDVWLLKIDRFGGKIWDKTFGGSRDDMGDSIQETSDGGFIIAGTTSSSGNGDADLLLIKTDSNGNEQWKKTFGGPGSERNPWSRGWSVQQTADGGFAMLGSTNSFGSGGYDIWFIKTDANGDLIADKVYGGAYDEEGGSLVETREGDHILIGSTSSFGSGGYDAWLIMADQNGKKIWDQTFGSKLDDKGYSVIRTDDGVSIFAGKTKPYIAPPPRKTIGCCDDGQPGEASIYYDGWLVSIRSAHPVIEIQPANGSACEGQEARFNVSATGSGPISYQWLKDGAQIAGATTDTYLIPAAKLADAGSYQLRVSNACGSVESNPAVLTISSKPIVKLDLRDKVACVGSEVALDALASGTEPLNYQWKKNGEDITGANTNRYLISSILPGDEGDYSLTVSNICGEAESGAVHLAVRSRPGILVQPISQTVCAGSPVSFEVQAAGNESYNYQWQKDGLNITAANDAVLSISAANSTDTGNYSVIVSSDLCGWIGSDQAELSIRSMPVVTDLLLPSSQLACEGSDISLAANVTGSDPFTFQWMKDGLQVPGANLGSYVIKNATSNDSGSYSLIVSNQCGQMESTASHIKIAIGPEIMVQPKSHRVCEGDTATFSVQAKSGEPLSYQWLKDGIRIEGATSEAYSIPEASPSDMGSYSVQVANNCSQFESEAARLEITAMPQILVQPGSLRVCQGTEATFSVQSESTEPLRYQWFRDGMEIPGANAESYSIPAANLSDLGSYSVQVSDNCSQTESEAAYLEIIAMPQILIQPASLRVCQGTEATFSVQAESTEPLRYQWFRDGSKIEGATSESYTISATNLSDLGSYSVQVSDNCSQIESEAAYLEIIAMPKILVQPASLRVCQETEATFSVQAESTEPLRYQWFKEGVIIPDATSDTYTIPVANLSHAGSYWVQAANNCSQIESEAVRLEVTSSPDIIVPPKSLKICEGRAASFSVQASSSEPMEYQWYKDDAEIEGATSDAYSIPKASPSDGGSYWAAVKNSCSQIESEVAVLDIIAMPEILLSPASQKICQGTAVTFTVQAESTEPVSYQWFKDGIEIPGATQDVYTIALASLNDTGSYWVQAANNCSQVISEPAYLEIVALPRILLPPVSQKVCSGAAVTFAVQAESTEPLSYQWFKDGIEIYEATADVYSIPATSNFDMGNYSVQVRNSCGQIESKAAYLEIVSMPEILLPPQSQRVCQGDAATFSVQASSSEPLQYQWFKDGNEIQEATAEVYIILAANLSDTASYSVQIRDGCNLIESEPANLETILVPKITLQPVSQNICQGAPVTFSVQAISNDPLSYQWFKDGVEIPGATAETYTIQEAAPGDKGRYSAKVRNGCGQTESEAANLDIIAFPEILVQPKDLKVCEGSTAKFQVKANSSLPLTYQWIKDSRTIRGANSEELTISDASLEDMGEYTVAISNCCGFVNSNTISLIVERPPGNVDIEPDCLIANAGETVALIMKGTAVGADSYQWEKNGEIIPGEVSPSLILLNTSQSDSGGYRLTVKNSCGSRKSGMSVLRVVEDLTKVDPCLNPQSPCCNSSRGVDGTSQNMG